MAQIFPFRGARYDAAIAGAARDVAAPPYDIIDAAGQKALYDRNPHNVIRLELGMDQPGDGPTNNRYTRAGATLSQWMQSGALKRDPQPTIYYHTIEYVPPGADPKGPRKTLRGFIATFKLEEFGTGAIYPHENTRAAAKTDRLNLMEACRANFSPIWSLYSDPQDTILSTLAQAAKSTAPCVEFRDDVGFEQRLWAISDPAVTQKVTAAMASKPIFIADGHHRYETALNYSKESDNPNAQYVMMTFVNMHSPGLKILATHRVLRNVSHLRVEELLAKVTGAWSVKSLDSIQALKHELGQPTPQSIRIGVVTGEGEWLLSRPRFHGELDVPVLHNEILGGWLGIGEQAVREGSHIQYVRGLDAAVAEVPTPALDLPARRHGRGRRVERHSVADAGVGRRDHEGRHRVGGRHHGEGCRRARR